MKRGLHLAPFGEVADVRVIGDLAAEAEAAGFDGVFVWDHIARPPERHLPVADTTIALAVIAQRTRSTRFGALVTPLTRRRPHKFAREMASLDILGGGRLVVGVGLGVNSGGELDRFAEISDEPAMAARLDEALDLICALWSGDEVHHRGQHFSADGVMFTPTPVQRPRPPIWVAARTARPGPMGRAARFDGLVPDCGPGELMRMTARIAELRGSLDGFEVVGKARPGADPDVWRAAGATWLLTEMPEQSSIADVRDVIDAGP